MNMTRYDTMWAIAVLVGFALFLHSLNATIMHRLETTALGQQSGYQWLVEPRERAA